MELKKIDVASCAKVAGILYALLGLVFGALFSLLSLVGAFAGEGMGGMLFGVGAIVLFPVMYGVLGAVFAAIGAALYNVVARQVGGIQLDLS